LLLACQEAPKPRITIETNPAAKGFNAAASDSMAVAIADRVMEKMGGRSNWDQTRIICWDFFGARYHIWDKQTGDVRISSKKDDYTVLMNLETGKGQVRSKGELITDPDSLIYYLEKGKEAWINDAYWLVMPFKLKDSGVTLKYVGKGKTADEKSAEILSLTFDGVGVTPDNKYHVYVDEASGLVSQWDFYPTAETEKPRFTTVWEAYKKYGNILLSGSRGPDYELESIAVYDELPRSVFDSFDAVELPERNKKVEEKD